MNEKIGNCQIVEEIGSGGMAVVYRAIQEPLGRDVAVKVLKPSIAIDSQFANRFEREAHFMASMQHENILHVYDFVKDGQTMFIIMEHVEGIDLYDLLEKAPRLPVEVAAVVALMVARALDYAHFRGVIHRDIKPANVILSKQGEVKLMDFGIARDDSLSDLTDTGTGLGTPSYMSPEQILGDRVDFRSDIFSLGILLYQMVTGKKPFVEDDSRTVMQKIRLDRYVSPRKHNPAVPRQLERIMNRCMEKMPVNRYPSTQVLIDDLVEFLAPRVSVNYNARIVLYLREIGVMSDSEADEVLEAACMRSVRHRPKDPHLIRASLLVHGVVLLCVLLGGGTIQIAHGGFGERPEDVEVEERPQQPRRLGSLRVVAIPWAHIDVDGQRVLTTPSAEKIALTPGSHWVKFTNPFYRELSQEVEIREGETQVLRVELVPLGATEEALQETSSEAEEIHEE